jgi:hypothetical protein
MPHLNPHRARALAPQHPYPNNIVQPRITPIPPRLEFAPQHRASVRQRKPLRLHEDIDAVVRADVVPRIGPDGARGISKAPICAEIEDRAWECVRWCGIEIGELEGGSVDV